jgi:hypothetical protein
MDTKADSIDSRTAATDPGDVSNVQNETRCTVRRIEWGHALLMTNEARETWPGSYGVTDVIEWEHGLDGDERRIAASRLRFLARAANNHHRLLSALRGLVECLNGDMDPEQCKAWDAAVAALERAEGR